MERAHRVGEVITARAPAGSVAGGDSDHSAHHAKALHAPPGANAGQLAASAAHVEGTMLVDERVMASMPPATCNAETPAPSSPPGVTMDAVSTAAAAMEARAAHLGPAAPTWGATLSQPTWGQPSVVLHRSASPGGSSGEVPQSMMLAGGASVGFSPAYASGMHAMAAPSMGASMQWPMMSGLGAGSAPQFPHFGQMGWPGGSTSTPASADYGVSVDQLYASGMLAQEFAALGNPALSATAANRITYECLRAIEQRSNFYGIVMDIHQVSLAAATVASRVAQYAMQFRAQFCDASLLTAAPSFAAAAGPRSEWQSATQNPPSRKPASGATATSRTAAAQHRRAADTGGKRTHPKQNDAARGAVSTGSDTSQTIAGTEIYGGDEDRTSGLPEDDSGALSVAAARTASRPLRAARLRRPGKRGRDDADQDASSAADDDADVAARVAPPTETDAGLFLAAMKQADNDGFHAILQGSDDEHVEGHSFGSDATEDDTASTYTAASRNAWPAVLKVHLVLQGARTQPDAHATASNDTKASPPKAGADSSASSLEESGTTGTALTELRAAMHESLPALWRRRTQRRWVPRSATLPNKVARESTAAPVDTGAAAVSVPSAAAWPADAYGAIPFAQYIADPRQAWDTDAYSGAGRGAYYMISSARDPEAPAQGTPSNLGAQRRHGQFGALTWAPTMSKYACIYRNDASWAVVIRGTKTRTKAMYIAEAFFEVYCELAGVNPQSKLRPGFDAARAVDGLDLYLARFGKASDASELPSIKYKELLGPALLDMARSLAQRFPAVLKLVRRRGGGASARGRAYHAATVPQPAPASQLAADRPHKDDAATHRDLSDEADVFPTDT